MDTCGLCLTPGLTFESAEAKENELKALISQEQVKSPGSTSATWGKRSPGTTNASFSVLLHVVHEVSDFTAP